MLNMKSHMERDRKRKKERMKCIERAGNINILLTYSKYSN